MNSRTSSEPSDFGIVSGEAPSLSQSFAGQGSRVVSAEPRVASAAAGSPSSRRICARRPSVRYEAGLIKYRYLPQNVDRGRLSDSRPSPEHFAFRCAVESSVLVKVVNGRILSSKKDGGGG